MTMTRKIKDTLYLMWTVLWFALVVPPRLAKLLKHFCVFAFDFFYVGIEDHGLDAVQVCVLYPDRVASALWKNWREFNAFAKRTAPAPVTTRRTRKTAE